MIAHSEWKHGEIYEGTASHGNVIGPDSTGRRRQLARIAQQQWVIDPTSRVECQGQS